MAPQSLRTVASRIAARVASRPRRAWIPGDFADLGPSLVVCRALQRLVADGRLVRVTRGIYYRARINPLTGTATTASVRQIVDAVGRRTGSKFLVDGLAAANDLGLTTAVPASVVFLTNARLRPIQVGNQCITFRTVARGRMYWAGRPAMRFVQALYWLRDLLPGDDGRLVHRLRAVLYDPVHGAAIRRDLRRGRRALPDWMQSTIQSLLSPSFP